MYTFKSSEATGTMGCKRGPFGVLGVLSASMLAAACAGDVSDLDNVGSSTDPLYINLDDIWPGAGTSRIDLNVCWENPSAATSTWRNDRRKAVEGAWSRYARINFNQWDTCTNNEPGIHVRICTAAGQVGCDSYPQSQTDVRAWADGLNNGIELNINHPPSVAIHEFGHALGFYHEEERPEYDGSAVGSGDCRKQTWPNSNPRFYGEYDQYSIMSYCDPGTILSPRDIAGIQRSYARRIPGTLISSQANCAAAKYTNGIGEPGFVWDCDEANDDQEWRMRTSSNDDYYLELTGPSGNRCLAASSATDGAGVALAQCDSTKDWTFQNVYLRGYGGLCLDLPGGNTTNGTRLRMWECDATEDLNERFSITSAGKIKFGSLSSNKCIRNVGWTLQIWDCGATNETMAIDGSGQITNLGKCMDVQNVNDAQFISGQGGPVDGNLVQFVDCNGSLNQRWNLFGAIRYGANRNLCLTREGGENNGGLLSLRPCDGRQSQDWDYYFRL